MQYHLNGFRPGDPKIHSRQCEAKNDSLPQELDVLIVGAGPAGSVLAAQLAEFADLDTRIIDQRSGPLEFGQADGVACRTVEMLAAFDLDRKLIEEAYQITETTFWGPDDEAPERITRTGQVTDVVEGLSEFPHLVVNQARMQDFLVDHMKQSPTGLTPDYGYELRDLSVEEGQRYPVLAHVVRTGDSLNSTPVEVRAKYVVGCDGARSAVRRSLGISMHGDARNHAWGVMDVLAVTDFPDVRKKSAIQSANDGSILMIPREGGYLVRLYVDLGDLEPGERGARSKFTSEMVIEKAKRIMHPFSLEIKEIAWWSVYEVGQRIAERFDDILDAERGNRHPRVFIAGDACHTHSAQAGQGMNVSMQDAFNLGWKLAAVLQDVSPEQLLRTYSDERKEIAQELIDFDRRWSDAMAARPTSGQFARPGELSVEERQQLFTEGGVFTAGFATQYPPNLITGSDIHQQLAAGIPIGKRFHSAPVIRLADAKLTQLGHHAKADGRWRLYLFADNVDPHSPMSKVRQLCDFLAQSPLSPLRRYTRPADNSDAVLDVRAVYRQDHRALMLENLPDLLFPRKGRFGLTDYEKVFTADSTGAAGIFEQRGISDQGAIVIVRPDQYVANVLPMDGFTELGEFFEPVLK